MSFPVIEVKIGTKHYSELLSQIADPPKILYCRGNIGLMRTTCFAVVGTRRITSYGKEATERMVSGLADTGWTIVSGLALGIDAAAHRTALDNNLPTIAVLGSTVNDGFIGPRTNAPLAEEILENNGLLISEYKTEANVNRANFAARDRIISGLSKGVLVVEGAEKSGSLITAKSAADQGRDVFAVPGNIFSAVSKGTNELIKQGAKMVTSANDILDEYGQNLELNIYPADKISTADPIHQRIIDILYEKGEITTDEIIRHSGMESHIIIAALSILELKKMINLKSDKYRLN